MAATGTYLAPPYWYVHGADMVHMIKCAYARPIIIFLLN